MIEGLLSRAALAAILMVAAQLAAAQVPVPPLKARVTDLTGTLTADQRGALEQKLAALESRKGSQLAVLIVPTTRPEEIEQYSIRVAEQWKLGRKGVDDGVLLLVAKDDRRLRIEVGYGLEGVLPDAIAKRIVDEVIVPHFREGQFHAGINAGVERIIGVIEGEKLPPPRARSPVQVTPRYFDLAFYGIAIAAILGGVLRMLAGRLVGAGAVAAAVGILAWIMVGTLIAVIVAALIAFLIALFNEPRAGRGGYRGGGWSSGSGYSGGGGGFSGGGGSFGGGGASGRW